MASPYELFKTDPEVETQGIRVNYGEDCWFTLARAGGANKRYLKAMGDRMKPYRRQIQTETLDEALAERLVLEVFVDTILIGWGSKELGDGKIPDQAGEALEFGRDNAIKVMTDLPELFRELRADSERIANFRRVVKEDDVKN